MLLGDRVRWPHVEVVPDDEDRALLVVVSRGGRTSLLGRGDPDAAVRLVERWLGEGGTAGGVPPLRWMSLPRGGSVPRAVLDGLGLAPFSTWDWMQTDRAPAAVGGVDVARLDPVADAPAIRACLAVANPGTTADPTHPEEAGWFGVRDGSRLLGVFGASWRGGPAPDEERDEPSRRSWHLHGLAVLPEARRRGLGAALTAAATQAGLDAGAAWVSLGLYADNDAARRIYTDLGFVVDGEFRSFGPPGADRPA